MKNQLIDLIAVKIYGNKVIWSCCQAFMLFYIFSLKSVSELDLNSYQACLLWFRPLLINTSLNWQCRFYPKGNSHTHGRSVWLILLWRSVLVLDKTGAAWSPSMPLLFWFAVTHSIFLPAFVAFCKHIFIKTPLRSWELDQKAQKDVLPRWSHAEMSRHALIFVSAGCRSISDAETISAPQRSCLFASLT